MIALGLVAALAACLGIGLIHAWRRVRVAEAEARRLRGEDTRRLDVIGASPMQFVCWDLTTGGEEPSPGLASLLGRTSSTPIQFAELCEAVTVRDRSALESAVAQLRQAGTEFAMSLAAQEGDRTLQVHGTATSSNGGTPTVAVLWIQDCSPSAERVERLSAQGMSLRRLLDFLPVPVWQRDADLKIEYVNRAYAAAVEVAPDATPGEIPELAASAGGARGRALAEKALHDGAPQSGEQYIVIGGARRLVEINEGKIPDDGRVAGFAIDRTEINEIKADLNRHIAGHEEVLQHLGTAVAIYDADQRLKFFNHAFVHLWRLNEQWLRTEPTMGEVLEALRDMRRLPEAANFPLFKTEQLKLFTSLLNPFEELIHLPDGTTLRSVITPHPFGGLLLTWEDVTDALALERSYNTLIAVQRETLDNLYEGVAVIGANGRLQLSNPVFGRMWQLPTELLATSPHISELVEGMRALTGDGDDWQSEKENIIGRLTDREGHTGRIERADGSVLDYATVPLPDGAGLLSYIDVSDSTRVERALRESNEALEAADRLKSEFIANVSYELRSPLTTIIGFAEILKNEYFGALNERQSEYSHGILESSHRLLLLINDILDLASIEAGQMTLELEPVNVHDLLSSVLTLTRERMRKKNLLLEFDCPLDIGTIVADERRLKQALFNIMSNSVKFTPDNGAVTVTARRDRDEVLLTFADTGIGISEQDRSRVFAKFERGSAPEARRSGAGLGLPLVKSFIELHGGRVELESAPGAGTKVVCAFPARDMEEADDLRIGTG